MRSPVARLDAATNIFRRADFPLFADPAKNDYHLTPQALSTAATRLTAAALDLPAATGVPRAEVEPPLTWQYRHPAGKEKRPAEKGLTLGAYTAEPRREHNNVTQRRNDAKRRQANE